MAGKAQKRNFDDILTIDEAAAFLKVTKDTVYRYAQAGRIPGFKVGNKWRFGKKVLEELMDGEKRK